ncbi:MAG: hypothetical protein WBC11_06060 [Dehalococcoidia bacterium]
MTEELNPELVKAAQEQFAPTKLKSGEELPPAVRQAMMEFMVPAIAKGVWEGIFALPDEARDIVFRAASKRCNEKINEFAGFDPGEINNVDEFMAEWEKAFGGIMKGKREGDTIYWEFLSNGCTAPEVMLGLIEPNPKLCQCSCHMIRQRFEMVTKSPVVVELLDSPLTTGADKCSYLIHLKPPLENAGGGR